MVFCLLLCGADLSPSSLQGELRVGGKTNHTERSPRQSEVTLNTTWQVSSQGKKGNKMKTPHTHTHTQMIEMKYELLFSKSLDSSAQITHVSKSPSSPCQPSEAGRWTDKWGPLWGQQLGSLWGQSHRSTLCDWP